MKHTLTEADWVEMRHIVAYTRGRLHAEVLQQWFKVRKELFLCFDWLIKHPDAYQIPQGVHDPRVQSEWAVNVLRRVGYSNFQRMLFAITDEYNAEEMK